MKNRRVAIVGMFLESNSFSTPMGRTDFTDTLYLVGEAIIRDAASASPRLMKEALGFLAEIERIGGIDPVPLLVTSGSTGGPVEHEFLLATIAAAQDALRAAGPLDGLYLCNHGAMTSTGDEDGDGAFFAAMRAVLGPDIPIVATLDPHANVSQKMLDAVDIVVAYRTDPHVDQRQRGAEAARLLDETWRGMKPEMVSVRLPIVPPNVSLFTASGPFGELVDLGQARMSPDIANVSVLGGFAFSDTSKNGLTVIVTGRDKRAPAEALCREISELAWQNRDRFVCEALTLDEAVARAVATGLDASLPPTVYSDLGDNCGAGGPANTLWLLEAMYRAGAKGVLVAHFCDPDLARKAHDGGCGARFEATFRGDTWGRDDDGAFRAPVEVLALHEGDLVGRHGIVAGRTVKAGRTCLLGLGDMFVTVTERRTQCNDPVHLEVLGIDIGKLRGLAVKLRASFRVAFDEFFAPQDMLMIDTPGRTSPMLQRLPFERLPRPCLPIDTGVTWRYPEN